MKKKKYTGKICKLTVGWLRWHLSGIESKGGSRNLKREGPDFVEIVEKLVETLSKRSPTMGEAHPKILSFRTPPDGQKWHSNSFNTSHLKYVIYTN